MTLLPNWSIMPPLDLFGLGTAEVESAEHYLSRLSWVTGCMIRPLLVLSAPEELKERVNTGPVFTLLCVPGENASKLVRGLEGLTGNTTIHCGTFANLRHILMKTALGRCGSQRRWCPACYATWDDDLSYEPLRWRVASVTTCSIHGVRLESACRHCGRSQYKVNYDKRRVCGFCARPLGHLNGPTNMDGYEAWVQDRIGDLITLCADPEQGTIPLSAYSGFCAASLEVHGASSHDVALSGHWATRIYLTDVLTGKPTSIAHLIDSCALQHVTPRDVLLRPLEAAAEPLRLNMEEHQFVGVPGERYGEVVRRFEKLTRFLLDSQRSAYLPKSRVLFRFCKVGRNVIVEHAPQAYYDYLAERRDRFGQAAGTHIDRAYRLMTSRASILRASHSSAARAKLVEHVVEASGVSQEHAAAALLGAEVWIGAVKCLQRSRRVAPFGLKRALAMAVIGGSR